MCIILAVDDGMKLWKNVSFFQKDEPNIIVSISIQQKRVKCPIIYIVVGDCAKIISGLFQSYYAMVLDSSYCDENEIQYFTEKETISGAKYWVLKENDLDSREKCELKKVVTALDNRDHYTFSDYQTVSKFAMTMSHI